MNRGLLISCLFLLILPFSPTTHLDRLAIQDSSAQGEIPGLVSSYGRHYEVDVEALLATPPTDMSQVYRSVAIQGFTFESESTAKTYLDEITTQVIEEEQVADKEFAVTVDELDLNNLDGFIYTSNFFTYMDDLVMGLTAIVFADGNQVFLVWVRDANVETSTRLAMDLAIFVSEARVKTDKVTFREDGTSTGGVFDRMPVSGDDLVNGLPSVTDTVEVEPAG